MAETEFESLRIDRTDSIAEVVLLGPGKGNAMGPAFWRELPVAFNQLNADDSVRAILLRGNGAHFSYGLDVVAMMPDLGPLLSGDSMAAARTALLALIRRMQGSINALADGKKPVVAAISGWCLGGGVDLISACDIRLCSADARFGVREVRLAITADMGSLQRLPRIIGDGQARRLALTGEDFDAARALRIGLVSDILDTPELLLTEARRLAKLIADNSPLVVQGIKQVMNFSRDRPVADGLEYVALWNSAFLQSEDFAEAVSSFMERRPAKFSGR